MFRIHKEQKRYNAKEIKFTKEDERFFYLLEDTDKYLPWSW